MPTRMAHLLDRTGQGIGRSSKRSIGLGATGLAALAVFGGTAWFQARYDDAQTQSVEVARFSPDAYPDDPEPRSRFFGAYPHHRLRIQQVGETAFQFRLEPGSKQAASIELTNVDLALLVAAVPPWARQDPSLTKIGLIDREWNRQQVSFPRSSSHVVVHEGGDGFEHRALSRVDLARNCLNAGLWELILFAVEEGEERVYDHLWFTFPLGLYKNLFERVNDLSYWDYWWSLEHWVDPSGTSIPVNLIRTVEEEWVVPAEARWTEAPSPRGEQALKRKNILGGLVPTYRDWYQQSVRFASFIPPGRYSSAHPRDTQLNYLAEFTGATLRRVRLPEHPSVLYEVELAFRDSRTGQPTRLLFGGLDLATLPVASPARYNEGWQAPMGLGNPSFFESYETLQAHPPGQRSFYGLHLDGQNRWLDHHAIGVDGPLLHWDDTESSTLHLYLISYERHALLNHFVLTCPPDACPNG